MMTPCVNWIGRTNPDGYGLLPNLQSAHRTSYEEAKGPIPAGLEIDHLCRNRRCVNPEHLEAVTHAENMRRRSEAQTHCRNGHEFTPGNTYYRKTGDGRRTCRACNRASVAAYKERRRAA